MLHGFQKNITQWIIFYNNKTVGDDRDSEPDTKPSVNKR